MLRGLIPKNTRFPRGLIFVTIVWVGLIVIVGPGYASTRIFTMVAPARERAIDWDSRDRVIRREIEAGNRDVVVWYIQDLNRLGDYTSDPNFSVNQVAADYYGIDSITALDQHP
jgi:hypothetical protein